MSGQKKIRSANEVRRQFTRSLAKAFWAVSAGVAPERLIKRDFMAIPQPPHPALQLVAVFSRHVQALEWSRTKIADNWGTIALTSRCFDHSETRYYETEMGSGLKKQFFVIGQIYDPARLANSKLQSNAWEQELANCGQYAERRPVNIDPGYLTLSKLVLASAKDRAHRIYLSEGIYAEECLYYLDHGWQARPWTYPDYQRADFHSFFCEARELLKQIIARSGGQGEIS